MMSSILVVECFRSHFTDVASVDTLFMADFVAFFAKGYILDVKSEYQVLIVHARFAHFPVVETFLEDIER